MLGQIIYCRRGAERTELGAVGNTTVLTAFVPSGKGLACAMEARRASKRFALARVRLAAFPEDYPYLKAFLRRGVVPSDGTALHRACADKLALCVLRQMGKEPRTASVALAARKRSAAFDGAAEALARCVRYLTISVPDGEALAERLRLHYGAAARLPEAAQRLRCDLAVAWDGGELPTAAPVLDLTDSALCVCYRPAEHSPLPRGISTGLLAAMVRDRPDYAQQLTVQSVGEAESNAAFFLDIGRGNIYNTFAKIE